MSRRARTEDGNQRRGLIGIMLIIMLSLMATTAYMTVRAQRADDAPKMTCAVTDARGPLPPLFLRGL